MFQACQRMPKWLPDGKGVGDMTQLPPHFSSTLQAGWLAGAMGVLHPCLSSARTSNSDMNLFRGGEQSRGSIFPRLACHCKQAAMTTGLGFLAQAYGHGVPPAHNTCRRHTARKAAGRRRMRRAVIAGLGRLLRAYMTKGQTQRLRNPTSFKLHSSQCGGRCKLVPCTGENQFHQPCGRASLSTGETQSSMSFTG